jgi:hypothetical protein
MDLCSDFISGQDYLMALSATQILENPSFSRRKKNPTR